MIYSDSRFVVLERVKIYVLRWMKYIYIEGSTSSSREELKLHKDMHGLSDPPVC